jgi:hypothetical protein
LAREAKNIVSCAEPLPPHLVCRDKNSAGAVFVLRGLPKTDVLQRAKYDVLRAFALAERAALDADAAVLVSEPLDQRLLGFTSIPVCGELLILAERNDGMETC